MPRPLNQRVAEARQREENATRRNIEFLNALTKEEKIDSNGIIEEIIQGVSQQAEKNPTNLDLQKIAESLEESWKFWQRLNPTPPKNSIAIHTYNNGIAVFRNIDSTTADDYPELADQALALLEYVNLLSNNPTILAYENELLGRQQNVEINKRLHPIKHRISPPLTNKTNIFI